MPPICQGHEGWDCQENRVGRPKSPSQGQLEASESGKGDAGGVGRTEEAPEMSQRRLSD